MTHPLLKPLNADIRQPNGAILNVKFTPFPENTTPQVIHAEFTDPNDKDRKVGEHFYHAATGAVATDFKPTAPKPDYWEPFSLATYQRLWQDVQKQQNSSRAGVYANEINLILFNRASYIVGSVVASVGKENNDVEAIKAFTEKFELTITTRDIHGGTKRYNREKRNFTDVCHIAPSLDELLDTQHGDDTEAKLAIFRKLAVR